MPSRTWTCTTRSTEHTARRPLMHIGFKSHLWLKSASYASSHPCMRTCGWCLELSVLFLVSFVLYLVSPFSFQPFLMSTSALNEKSKSNPLCDFRLEPWSHPTTRHPSQNDHCPIPNLLANIFTDSAFPKHSSLLSYLSQKMSLNIDINRILPVKDSGVCPIELSISLILPQSCNVVNPGKMFLSNSVDSTLIASYFCSFLSARTPATLFFQASLHSGC